MVPATRNNKQSDNNTTATEITEATAATPATEATTLATDATATREAATTEVHGDEDSTVAVEFDLVAFKDESGGVE